MFGEEVFLERAGNQTPGDVVHRVLVLGVGEVPAAVHLRTQDALRPFLDLGHDQILTGSVDGEQRVHVLSFLFKAHMDCMCNTLVGC